MNVNKNVVKMNNEQTMHFIDYYENEEILRNTKSQFSRRYGFCHLRFHLTELKSF